MEHGHLQRSEIIILASMMVGFVNGEFISVDSLNPNSETYAPEIFDEFWYSDPTIIVDGNNDTTIVIRPDTVGPFGYTFEVT